MVMMANLPFVVQNVQLGALLWWAVLMPVVLFQLSHRRRSRPGRPGMRREPFMRCAFYVALLAAVVQLVAVNAEAWLVFADASENDFTTAMQGLVDIVPYFQTHVVSNPLLFAASTVALMYVCLTKSSLGISPEYQFQLIAGVCARVFAVELMQAEYFNLLPPQGSPASRAFTFLFHQTTGLAVVNLTLFAACAWFSRRDDPDWGCDDDDDDECDGEEEKEAWSDGDEAPAYGDDHHVVGAQATAAASSVNARPCVVGKRSYEIIQSLASSLAVALVVVWTLRGAAMSHGLGGAASVVSLTGDWLVATALLPQLTMILMNPFYVQHASGPRRVFVVVYSLLVGFAFMGDYRVRVPDAVHGSGWFEGCILTSVVVRQCIVRLTHATSGWFQEAHGMQAVCGACLASLILMAVVLRLLVRGYDRCCKGRCGGKERLSIQAHPIVFMQEKPTKA